MKLDFEALTTSLLEMNNESALRSKSFIADSRSSVD